MERFAFLKQLAMKYARFPEEIMEDTLFSSIGMEMKININKLITAPKMKYQTTP